MTVNEPARVQAVAQRARGCCGRDEAEPLATAEATAGEHGDWSVLG
jgi:hypothetical protein